ncbi:MAG TPA: HAD family hydrolase [Methanomicrobia archaeon]|nr:HAD family hydrolase [Methanomicrobia archaeon]HEX59792.1 HAD family hydrolase [Methanomicrobia archaeon]
MRYDVVILDMDGTILDSRGSGDIEYKWAYNAFERTLARFGIRLTIDQINEYFLKPLILRGRQGVLEFCKRFGLDCELFWSFREQDVIEAKIEAMKRGEIKLVRDAKKVISYLSRKYELAVVSDSQQECVDFAMQYFRLTPFFRFWYGRGSRLEDLDFRKPNPYYINLVLHKLHTKNAILVDDSQLGVLAAKRAGIASALIWKEPVKIKYEPTHVIRDLAELETIL